MKRRIALFTVLLAFLVFVELIPIEESNANPTPQFPSLIITSPNTCSKNAYTGNSISIQYDLYITNSSSDLSTISLYYSLDDGDKISIPSTALTNYRLYEEGHSPIVYTGDTNISGIPNGEHKVTVYAKTSIGECYCSSTFIMDNFNFPTGVIVALLSLFVLVSMTLVYFNRRQKLAGKQSFL
jgi:hypothetical protein